MREEIERVLVYLARLSSQTPSIQVALGYLLYDPGRVEFVHQIRDERVLAMAISVHRRIEVPMAPWQGYVRGVPVPDPLTWIQGAKTVSNQPIAVRVSTDDPFLLARLQPLIQPDQDRVERRRMEQRMQDLRRDVDETLDIYNEVRHIMEVDPERQEELNRFLNMAQTEMQALGQELKNLKARLGSQSSST